jgi:hypothetical protein
VTQVVKRDMNHRETILPNSSHRAGRGNSGRHKDDATGCGAARGDGADSTTSQTGQKIMSDRDLAIQRVRKFVEEAPEIREDRVAAAKHALQARRLNLRGTDLAEKLLGDILHSMGSEP